MKRLNAVEIIGLAKRAESLQEQLWSHWDELSLYIQPSKVGFVTRREPGEKRTERLWDSTAPQACDDLAHYLAAGLTPAASPWLDLAFRQKELQGEDAFVEWLQACAEIERAELQRSNFYEVMGEVYKDLPAFGNACPQAEERKDHAGNFAGLHFEAVWLREITALPNQYGEFDTTFRTYEQSALQWVQMFGKDDVGEKVAKLAAEKPEQKVRFIHAVYPRDRDDIDLDGVAKGTANGLKMPYASAWVNCEDKVLVRESGYLELPRYIVRWARQSGNPWGIGPGSLALPDVRTLNEAKRLDMIAWEKELDPPLKVLQNSVVDSVIDQSPGGKTILRDMNGVQRLYDGTTFNVSTVKVDELKASILRTFFADLIREPTADVGAKTAYEVAKRLERAQRILGEAVGHLRGMLRWSVERSFKILYRNDRFPAPPPELLQAGAEIDIRYTSPLQMAQEAQSVEQIAMFMGDLHPLAALNQEVLDHVNWDGMVLELARRRNVPATALNSKREIEEIRSAREEAQAQANQMAQAEQAGKVIRDVGAGLGPEQAAQVAQSLG